jgi:hypothetical protein
MTDTLGITKTGFGDLFNAVRIDGTGLGTWITSFALLVGKAWSAMCVGMRNAWQSVTVSMSLIWNAFMFSIAAALKGYLSAWYMLKGQTAPQAMESAQKVLGPDLNPEQRLADSQKKWKQYQVDAAKGDAAYEKDMRQREKEIQELFKKDPQSGTGVSVDTERARKGLNQIAETAKGLGKDLLKQLGVGDALQQIEDLLNKGLPELPGSSWWSKAMSQAFAGGGPFGSDRRDLGVTGAPPAKPEYSVLGTFSGAAAAQLAGDSIGGRIANATAATATASATTASAVSGILSAVQSYLAQAVPQAQGQGA